MRVVPFVFGTSMAGLFALVAACSVSTTPYTGYPLDDAGTSEKSDGSTTAKKDSGKDTTEPPDTTANTVCEKVCANAASAKCSKASSCVSDCEADQAKIPAKCKSEADALNACAAKSKSFKCSSSGKAVLDGDCESEGTALVACVTGEPTDPPPATCGPVAKYFESAQCETCRKTKCCTESAACGNNNACVAIINCIANEGCTTQACVDQCEAAHPNGKTAEQNFFECIATDCDLECQ